MKTKLLLDSWAPLAAALIAAASLSAYAEDKSAYAERSYTGTVTADDLTMRVSEAADGQDAVSQVLAFAQALSEATSCP